MKKLLLIFLMSYLSMVTLSAQNSEVNPVIIDFGNQSSFELMCSFDLSYPNRTMVYFKLIGDYALCNGVGNPNRTVIVECLRDENVDFTMDIKVNGQWVELDDDDGMNYLPKAAFYHSIFAEKLIRIRPYNPTTEILAGAIFFRAYSEISIYSF